MRLDVKEKGIKCMSTNASSSLKKSFQNGVIMDLKKDENSSYPRQFQKGITQTKPGGPSTGTRYISSNKRIMSVNAAYSQTSSWIPTEHKTTFVDDEFIEPSSSLFSAKKTQTYISASELSKTNNVDRNRISDSKAMSSSPVISSPLQKTMINKESISSGSEASFQIKKEDSPSVRAESRFLSNTITSEKSTAEVQPIHSTVTGLAKFSHSVGIVGEETNQMPEIPIRSTDKQSITFDEELFRTTMGIDLLTWNTYNLRLDIAHQTITCTESLFDGLSKNANPTFITLLPSSSSFTLPSHSHVSAHGHSPLFKRPLSISNDQLTLAKNAIKLGFTTTNFPADRNIPFNFVELIPRSHRGFFGINSLRHASETLFLVFNDPLSAMTLFHKTKLPALSLPFWMEEPAQLQHLASLLSTSFSKVVFICNGTPSSNDPLSSLEPLQRHFSSLLQRWRCHVVLAQTIFNASPIPISMTSVTPQGITNAILTGTTKGLWQALALLVGGPDGAKPLLDLAIPLPAKNVIASSGYLAQVRHELTLGTQALWGTPLLWSLPQLTNIMKGLRPGELTVLTGPTGAGKTTILSLFSIDWCEQQVPTLWGSFEIPNHRILKKMMIQHRGKQFSEDPHQAVMELETEAAYFSKLPLHFMNFFGSTAPFSDVLETMAWAVQNLSIKHIILDNLQFMTSGHGGPDRSPSQLVTSFTKFDYQDRVVAEIRRFVTETNCHVTLVIHPRKEQDNTVLGISSVAGTAKATQEADNVLILQKIGQRHSIDVRKNRFDGELGRVVYTFDRDTLRVGMIIPNI